MLLVDSSVWIDWLRGAETDAVRFTRERENHEELAITQMIYLEVLQGVSSDRQFAATRQPGEGNGSGQFVARHAAG